MKSNEKIVCPACGEQTIAKSKRQLVDFNEFRDVLTCMLCGAELGVAEADSANAPNTDSDKLDKLGALLGSAPVAAARIAAADDEKRFCKDCVHFLRHPFVDRCDIDNHPVEAMDDCPKFAPRK